MIEFKRASVMTSAEKSAAIVGSDPAYFQQRRWALEAARLLHEADKAPDAEKAAAEERLSKHYRTRDDVELKHVPLARNATDGIAVRQRG